MGRKTLLQMGFLAGFLPQIGLVHPQLKEGWWGSRGVSLDTALLPASLWGSLYYGGYFQPSCICTLSLFWGTQPVPSCTLLVIF